MCAVSHYTQYNSGRRSHNGCLYTGELENPIAAQSKNMKKHTTKSIKNAEPVPKRLFRSSLESTLQVCLKTAKVRDLMFNSHSAGWSSFKITLSPHCGLILLSDQTGDKLILLDHFYHGNSSTWIQQHFVFIRTDNFIFFLYDLISVPNIVKSTLYTIYIHYIYIYIHYIYPCI